MFPSTSLLETYAISSSSGCPPTTQNLTFPISNGAPGEPCAKSRGGLYNLDADKDARNFDSDTTSPTVNKTIYSLNDYATFRYYGGDFKAYGFTSNLSFGDFSTNRQLFNVPIYDLADWDYTWLGLLGIRANPSFQKSNATASTNQTQTLLRSMKDKRLIPRLSWGYTAGSFNRNSFGSLILGGHDANRFDENDVKFKFSQDEERPFTLDLANIKMIIPGSLVDKQSSSNSNSQSITETSVSILTNDQWDPDHKYGVSLGNQTLVTLNSNLPYIYLPPEYCQKIATSLNLTLNQNSNRYIINDDVHQKLLQGGMSLNFTFDSHNPHGKLVSIVLNYPSLNLYDGAPFGNGGRYFPMRVGAPNNYQLGRAFFQDAYVIADYEDRQYSIHQVNYNNPASVTKIVSHSLNQDFPQATGSATPSTGLGPGGIAGIVVGSICFVVIILLFIICRKARLRVNIRTGKPAQLESKELTMTGSGGGSTTISSTLAEVSTAGGSTNMAVEVDGTALHHPAELHNHDIQEMPDNTGSLAGHYKAVEIDDGRYPIFEMESHPIPSGWFKVSPKSLPKSSSPEISPHTSITTIPSPPAMSNPLLASYTNTESTLTLSEKKDTILPLPKIVPVVPRNSSAIRDRLKGIDHDVIPSSPIPQTPLEYYGGVMPDIRWKQAQQRAIEKGIERERIRREERDQTARDRRISKANVVDSDEQGEIHAVSPPIAEQEHSEGAPSPPEEHPPSYTDLRLFPQLSPVDEKENPNLNSQADNQEPEHRPSLMVAPTTPNFSRPVHLTPSSPIPKTPERFYTRHGDVVLTQVIPPVEED